VNEALHGLVVQPLQQVSQRYTTEHLDVLLATNRFVTNGGRLGVLGTCSNGRGAAGTTVMAEWPGNG
jgi:hypothetical protein